MQVDPIKPTLPPPETQSLKLRCDEMLSTFAFHFNLHHYNKAEVEHAAGHAHPLLSST